MKKLLVVSLVLALAAPALAAEWNWYGSARIILGWTSQSDDVFGNPMVDDNRINGIPLGSGNVLNQPSDASSTIGANIQAGDAITGHFEIGNTSSETAKFRYLTGKWNFGPGTLLVGHTHTVMNSIAALPNGMDDDTWVFHGHFYEGRRDQITLQFGGLEISAIQNLGISDGDLAQYESLSGRDLVETAVIPKLEAVYAYKNNAFFLKAGAGFQTFEIETADGRDSDSVNSYAFLLDARYRPGFWFVAAGAWYVVNPTNYGMFAGAGGPPYYAEYQNGLNFTRAAYVNGEVEDSSMYTIYLLGGIGLSKNLALSAGVSYMASSADYQYLGPNLVEDGEDDAWNWFFQVPITLAEGVKIIPEVGGHHFGDDEGRVSGADLKLKNGEWYYFTTKFQIDF